MRIPVAAVLAGCLALVPACVIHAHRGASVTHIGDYSKEARREVDLPLVIGIGGVLECSLDLGSLKVTAADGPPSVRGVIVARASSEAEAERVLQEAEVRVERRGDDARVELRRETRETEDRGARRVHLSADLRITVPPGVRLDLRAGSGNVVAEGPFGKSKVRSSFGRVEVSHVSGGLDASSGSGEIVVSSVRGGDLAVRSSFGRVVVREIDADSIAAGSGSGEVRGEDLAAAKVTLDTSFGAIRAQNVRGALTARTGSGSIAIEDAHGPVSATSNFGAVEATGVFDVLELHSGSGSVTARAQTGSKVGSAWSLSSNFGGVMLHVPEGFACDLSAKTSFGDVDLQLPIEVEAGGLKKGSREVSGRIGGGGGRVTLSSGSGPVGIRPSKR